MGSDAYALIDPFVSGTIAMFEVMAPSKAFNVATVGCDNPCGHIVMYPSGPGGTTVALNTYACALAGAPHPLELTFTLMVPRNGGVPAGRRVSFARHGIRL